MPRFLRLGRFFLNRDAKLATPERCITFTVTGADAQALRRAMEAYRVTTFRAAAKGGPKRSGGLDVAGR